ncbi:uncharacterized protein BXZ73DRAFT_79050 [Epithele typhae]|uniref:uncharacterized protein n=1 Tax=Epithele typhae TaxID=378194 RepID=UPI00200731D4|nr:uncharacterized protein BXZ73DRAFT_79050 [Epithele typhae]KAH9925387.1 hypothetical protein BXZ73DRAFT_79050 [Epithele typhae]
MVGSFVLDPKATNPYTTPQGTRIHSQILGGNFTDLSGKLVATLFPTSENGRMLADGTFYPETTFILNFVAENKLAYVRLRGVGVFGSGEYLYAHIETESQTYGFLNTRFIIANNSIPADSPLTPQVTLFGLV